MDELLWITLPINEKNSLKNVMSLISSRNLTNLSINQLIEKLENNQAADWLDVLSQYHAIPAINNINVSEMLDRAKGIRSKFGQRYPQLKDREFESQALLSLIILCYSNPNLIGPKLCKALNEADETNIKKEMLENSARVGNRVAPWASNLRLMSTALYFNDTDMRLPDSVIDRVTTEAIRDRRIVRKLDSCSGFEALIEGPTRAGSDRVKRDQSEIDSYYVLWPQLADSAIVAEDHTRFQLDCSSLGSSIAYPIEGSELITETLPLHATNNAAKSINNQSLAITGLVGFHLFKNLPVISPVVHNVGKDLKRAGQYVGSLFSRNSESEEPQEERTTVLSPT